MNIRLLLERFERFRGQPLPELTIIGGGSRNPYWMHLLAEISKRRIANINLKQEANCFAAAQCAGVGVGVYRDFNEVKQMFKVEQAYQPDPSKTEFYDRKFEAFLEAYQGMLKTYDMMAELEQFATQ